METNQDLDVQPLLDLARTLEARGEVLEAIDYLMAKNEQLHNAQLEHTLVGLRHRAVRCLPDTPAINDWPPCRSGRKLPINRIPEAGLNGLTAELLNDAIHERGSLIVRELIAPREAASITSSIDRVLALQKTWINNQTITPDATPWFTPFRSNPSIPVSTATRSFVNSTGGAFTADSPRMLFRLLTCFRRTGVLTMLERYLGERPVMSIKKCTLRRVAPDSPSAWHQDGRFLGEDNNIRAINLWLALSDCGDDAPSLDIIPDRLDYIVGTGTHDAPFEWTVADKVAQNLPDAPRPCRPRFAPGDAILFDDYNLHRTGSSEHMTQHRYAIETWFFAASGYPTGHPVIIA